jgi:outer membrane lipoprotein-sorting protein
MTGFLLLSLALAARAGAQSDSARKTIAAFEANYRGVQLLEATFLERYFENGKLVRADAGISYFRRPGRMRWEYQSPEKNLFLVDGKWAWFYVPADHTVTRVPAKQSSDWRTPVALLADNPKLSRVCAQVAASLTVEPLTPSDTVLFCRMKGPKPNQAEGAAARPQGQVPGVSGADRQRELQAAAEGTAVFLEINPETGVLSRVLVTQPGRVSIDFQFTHWQFNPPLPESLFHFDVPPNTAIVNGELPSQENSTNH